MRGLEKVRICRLRHLNRYISGTRSVRQMTSKLDQWPDITFQMSLSVSISVQPSPRNRCEFGNVRIFRLRYLNRYISGTESVCKITYELDQWPDITFQMSLSVSKSIQPSPKNRCEFENVRIFHLRYLNRYISGTGSVCQMTYELDQWPNITFQMSLSVSKSVKPSLRNRCEFERMRICPYVTKTVISPEPELSAQWSPNLINGPI